jgi:4-hydroxymandelate oxidase
LDSADFDALEDKARAKLSPGAYAFAVAGADDEITLADNIAAWRRLRLRPRVLNDINTIDTSVSILGAKCETPIMVAPFGRHKLFHPEGERATARGAAAAGAVFVLPTTRRSAWRRWRTSLPRRAGSSSTCRPNARLRSS